MVRGSKVRFFRVGPVPQTPAKVLLVAGDNPRRSLLNISVEGAATVRLYEQDRESSDSAGYLLEATAGFSTPLILLGAKNAVFAGAASGAAVFLSVAEVADEDIG